MRPCDFVSDPIDETDERGRTLCKLDRYRHEFWRRKGWHLKRQRVCSGFRRCNNNRLFHPQYPA